VTGNDPEVMSFDQKPSGRGCRRQKTHVYCTFHFLQGCSSQQDEVTWEEIMSHYLTWPKVNQKWRHFTGSHLEYAVEGWKLVYWIFHFLQGCNSQEEAVTGKKW